jgi:hypothetical protein
MKKLLLSILAVILIVEEWLWDALNNLAHILVKRLRLDGFEKWLMGLTPRQSVIAFVIPLLIVTPINLLALGLIIHGMVVQGVLLELFAKIFGTLFISRVFSLTKPQLLTFKFISFVYTVISHWLSWAHQKIIETPIYNHAVILKSSIRNYFIQLVKG